jgi:glycosyltransferase involved in cell wall biosynthesis
VRSPLSRRRIDQLGTRLGFPIPYRLLVGRHDLVYSPDFVAPVLRATPRIVTVHDVAFLTHPHLTTPGNVAFLTRAVEREVRRGALLATVSLSTKQRLIDALRVDDDRVRVIRNGVDARFLHAEPIPFPALRRLGIPREFLLMVGTIEPRKNHAAVMRVIARHDHGLPVVIVGRQGWGSDAEVEAIRALEAAERLVWLDNLGDDLLPGLYASSRGVLYPSWTEGFGLPVLEALAAGRPVVTGSDDVFREVGGPHVSPVDPEDDDALLDAIKEIEEAPDDPAASDARRRHAAQYGWDEPVTMLVEWMRAVLEGQR